MNKGSIWQSTVSLCAEFVTPEFGAAMALVSGFPVCFLNDAPSSCAYPEEALPGSKPSSEKPTGWDVVPGGCVVRTCVVGRDADY